MESNAGPTKLGRSFSQEPICLGLMPQQPGMIGLAEDWTGLTNPAERRKLQNRRNQRAYRKLFHSLLSMASLVNVSVCYLQESAKE